MNRTQRRDDALIRTIDLTELLREQELPDGGVRLRVVLLRRRRVVAHGGHLGVGERARSADGTHTIAGVEQGRVGVGRRRAAIARRRKLERARVLTIDVQAIVLGHRRVGDPFAPADRIRALGRARVGDGEPAGGNDRARSRLIGLDHVRVDARVVVGERVFAQNERPVGRGEVNLLRARRVRRVDLQELMGTPPICE